MMSRLLRLIPLQINELICYCILFNNKINLLESCDNHLIIS